MRRLFVFLLAAAALWGAFGPRAALTVQARGGACAGELRYGGRLVWRLAVSTEDEARPVFAAQEDGRTTIVTPALAGGLLVFKIK